eukprot:TRINITY_DN6038_c0_g1_i1.p1 TRINITY_DN6038_c0_g1~~TRINITY_DN6038_c0_g1_i1.p1  ORF type:complete len:878 (-),score=148.80 TRINITY_DN6038_c0_g1_i1:8-2620(-)
MSQGAPAPNAGSAVTVSSAVFIILAVLLGLIFASDHYFAPIKQIIMENQFLQAFLLPGFLGCVAYTVNEIIGQIGSRIASRYFCSVSISNKDENFDAVLAFVSSRCDIKSGNLMAFTKKKKNRTWKERMAEHFGTQRTPPQMEYRPDNDTSAHLLRYKGRRILLRRTKGETLTTGWNRKPLQLETLSLSCWGQDNSVLKEIVDLAVKDSFVGISDEISIYVLSSDFWASTWERAFTKKARTAESVILDETLSEALIHDAEVFLASEKWYMDIGIPYRRGYMLYGPPGCGKTSTAEVIAGALKLDICMLTLSNKELDDSRLASCLRDAPKRSIVLLEDVDAVFVERTAQKEGGRPGVTFSGLLNAIDGVASQEGRLFLMTTNHFEKLDAALVRPGRCDVKIELRRASRTQMQRLFLRFFPGEDGLALEFSSRLPEFEISMAQLQGHLLECKEDATLAIENVSKLLQATKPIESGPVSIFDHLRRVGLQHLAPFFEHYGYNCHSDLKGLDVEKVSAWCPEMQHLPTQVKARLKQLLDGDEDLMRVYQLADISQLKETFHAAFPNTESDGEDSSFSRQNSVGLIQSSTLTRSWSVQGDLARQFCDKLVKKGKGLISVWQLRRLLELHDLDPQDALDNIPAYIRPRQAEEHSVPWLTVRVMLRRLCMEQYAPALEANRIRLMIELAGTPVEEIQKLIGTSDAKDAAVIVAVLEAQKRSDLLAEFQPVEFLRVREIFRVAYPAATETQIRAFSAAVTDSFGNGQVSSVQLKRHFAHFSTAEAALENVTVMLVPPESPAKESAPWIQQWLDEGGLGIYAAGFIANGITTKEDLLEPTPLEEFDSVGVKVLGHKRKLLKMVKALQPPPEPSTANTTE